MHFRTVDRAIVIVTVASGIGLMNTPSASAQVVPIGPFVGDKSEDLENVAPWPGIIDEHVDVFDGDVTFHSLVNDTTIHLWGGSCLFVSGGTPDCANPRSGLFLIGATTGQEILFNEPVLRFGAYFTNNSLTDDGTVKFFDTNGLLLGSLPLNVPTAGSDWYWQGWESDVPLGRITIRSHGVLHGFIWLDDLEMTPACAGPSSFCATSPNSSGTGALIGSSGSTSVAANDLGLEVEAAALSQTGLFYYGPEQVSQPFGDGLRCVGGGPSGVFRLDAVTTDATGSAAFAVDLTDPPEAAGQIVAGETWYFQFWYRDPAGPGGHGFNLSDGLAVSFCP